MTRARRRHAAWSVPAVVALGVAAGVLISAAGPSDAAPTLPAKTPQQLLTAIAGSSTRAFSGTVRETAAFGLPSLPGGIGAEGASLSWQSLITGTHTANVWVDGPFKQRIGVLGQLSEAEVVHNGRDLWTYTSTTNTATHSVLPNRGRSAASSQASGEHAFNPATAAADVLKNIDQTTGVTVDTAQRVAGRAAYTLVLTPRDPRSTVHSVRIAVDAQHYLPLRLQVFASGSAPAFQVGFTRISFATPAASQFRFTVPRGATVTNDPFADRRHTRVAPPVHPHLGSTVIGSGWTAVVELHGAADGLTGVAGLPLDKLTTPVGTSGARLLHTALVNAVFLPDGRVFLGAVDPATVEHIAATTAH